MTQGVIKHSRSKSCFDRKKTSLKKNAQPTQTSGSWPGTEGNLTSLPDVFYKRVATTNHRDRTTTRDFHSRVSKEALSAWISEATPETR